MPKDLSQMQITVLVPTNKVHEISTWLEDHGATSMMVRAYRNGATPTPAPKAPRIERVRVSDGLSTVEKSRQQQEWIAHHAKGDFTVDDIKKPWKAVGFAERTLIGALKRAVDMKTIKRLSRGHYRRIA